MAFPPAIKGLGSVTLPSPSASTRRRVIRTIVSSPGLLPLHLAHCSGRRTLGAVLQPLGDFGKRRHVDIGRPRPGKDAGNIEIGDRKILSEQVWTAAERTVEHAKRLRELLLTGIGRCSIALALGIDRSVQQ